MDQIATQQLITDITSVLGGTLVGYTPLGPGIASNVFRARIDGAAIDTCVVKLSKPWAEEPFEAEDAHQRTYGSRWSNFEPAYVLLQQHGLPVPQLLDKGTTQNGEYNYMLMEYLRGPDVRDYLSTGGDADMGSLHFATGQCMAKLHKITRPHHGWVEAPAHSQNWRSTFFAALNGVLQTTHEGKYLPAAVMAQLQSKVVGFERSWTEPHHFVLAHGDGFQAVAQQRHNGWGIAGLVDIEDHHFADPRFVLAGHELVMELHKRTLPQDFWDGYGAADPSVTVLKEYFKLFYLADWLNTLSGLRRKDEAERVQMLMEAKLSGVLAA